MKPLSADQVINALGLTPHPEGGFFRETYRANASVNAPFTSVPRAASTAIYFLLRSGDYSAFHSVRSDEVWHHYLGATLELHTIDAAGEYERIELGPNLLNGEVPQWVVPANHLQGARIIGDGFGLFGCTVAPGFDFADFNIPPRAELVTRFPALADLIESFTR
ncbi:MAG: cupin domain-containing protein [Gammaproteobacteria bacterium]